MDFFEQKLRVSGRGFADNRLFCTIRCSCVLPRSSTAASLEYRGIASVEGERVAEGENAKKESFVGLRNKTPFEKFR